MPWNWNRVGCYVITFNLNEEGCNPHYLFDWGSVRKQKIENKPLFYRGRPTCSCYSRENLSSQLLAFPSSSFETKRNIFFLSFLHLLSLEHGLQTKKKPQGIFTQHFTCKIHSGTILYSSLSPHYIKHSRTTYCESMATIGDGSWISGWYNSSSN